jgi:beta-galactosidase GanA
MFVYGTQYYRSPTPPREDWARDMVWIREHGFNTVKHWIPWTWMNPSPDAFDFSDIDELMELATKHDLKVVLNVILENAPYWLEEQYPEAHYRANDGTIVRLTAALNTPCGGWPGLCLDNIPIREQASQLLSNVAVRYRSHPALLAYDVWNEPHMEPTWYYPDKMFCYCEASVAKFREWLKAKYGDLETLNRVWARRFSAWDQVSPPYTFEVYPDILDWKRFWLENLGAWLAWKTQVVRNVDDQHPIMTHVASSAYLGTLPVNTWDEWLLVEPVDLFGTSSFPKWLMQNDPAVHMFHLDMVRSAARGKPFWQAELQGGHGRDIGYSRTPQPTPDEIRMWNWNVLASGAKGLLYWCWRPELLGPESPGYALCNSGGIPSARAGAAAEMAEFIQSVPGLAESVPVESGIGIIVSRDTAILNYAGDRDMLLYARALLGTYRAFFDQDIPVSFVHTDVLGSQTVANTFKYLYYPLPFVADATITAALEAFVAGGGVLVAEACPGHFSENGWCSTRIPGQGLHRLFGVEEIETDRVDQVEIQLKEPVGALAHGPVVGRLYRETLKPIAEAAQVVGVFADGTPAMTCNRYGQGKAYLIGTSPSLAYEDLRPASARLMITAFHTLRDLEICRDPTHPNVETRLHRHAGGYLLILLNWGQQDEEFELWVRGMDLSKFQVSPEADVSQSGRIRLKVRAMNGYLLSLILR